MCRSCRLRVWWRGEDGVMPLTGEYEPSVVGWARKQAELFERTNGAEGNLMQGRPIIVLTRRQLPARGPGWRAQGPAGRRQDPVHRPERGRRVGAGTGPGRRTDRIGAEPLQPL